MTEPRPTYRTGKSARRKDANQPAIEQALKAAGWRVVDVSGVGRGLTDLIAIDPAGRVLLIEAKDETDGITVTPAELDFMVYLVTDAYRVICSTEQVVEHLRRGE